MRNNLKHIINFSIGIFDKINENIIEKIEKEIPKSQFYGIGIYTDDVVIKKYQTQPINNLEERMKLAKQIEGVNFVFFIDKSKKKKKKKIIENACKEYLVNK